MLTNGSSGIQEEDADTITKWVPMRLLRILKDDFIHALMKRFRGDADWTTGWPRGSDSSSGHLGEMDIARRESMSRAFWAGFEDLALLQIESEASSSTGVRAKLSALRRDLQTPHPQIEFSVIDPATVKKGTHLMLIASPYGILSPSVFHNCVYTSMVSNIITMDAPTKIASPSINRSANLDDTDGFTSMLSRTPVFQYSTTPAASNSSQSFSSPNASGTALTSTIQQGKARAKRLKSAVIANTVDRISSSSLQAIASNPCVVLIDQAGLPGCEGGPVFDSQGSLLGLLAPPLRRSDGSNVEVHLVLPIYPFLQQLVREVFGKVPLLGGVGTGFKLQPVSAQAMTSRPQETLSSQAMRASTQVVTKVIPSIVVISIGTFWGSGVVVSPDGYVITSAHIFRSFLLQTSSPQSPKLKTGYSTYIRIDSESIPVCHGPPSPPNTFQYDDSSRSTSLPNSSGVSMISGGTRTLGSKGPTTWHKATLVYISSSHLDVALVKIDTPPSGLSVLRICSSSTDGHPIEGCVKEPREGEPVLALGFALFGPSKRIKATITSGVVSRVAHLHGQPKLIQTSTSVNKGASGGALVDAHGNFVGLVTCNAMTKDGIIIPKINFSIPANLLLPIDEFIRTQNWEVLEAIERGDPECAALWSMSSLSEDTSPHPTPGIPDLAARIQQFVKQQQQQIPPPSSADTNDSSSIASQSTSTGNFSPTQSNIPTEERGSKLREFWNTQLGSVPNAFTKAKL